VPHHARPSHRSVDVRPRQAMLSTDEVWGLVQDLRVVERRENALLELSKRREQLPDLGPVLWYTFGCVVALMQEVLQVYPLLASPSLLTAEASNRVCNSLALLQCIAAHPETRSLFIKAHIPTLLYPLLNSSLHSPTSRRDEEEALLDRPFEYLRLTALGVLGAMVKVEEVEVIDFLVKSDDLLLLCLDIMQTGSELSRSLAVFILHKILHDDKGLAYICATAHRFYQVSSALGKMVESLQWKQTDGSSRLLKHVVKCYTRLAENARAKEGLRQCLPACLKVLNPQMDPHLSSLPEPMARSVREDATTKRLLLQLISELQAR